jgi:predicted nucleotidyltransferase
VGFEEIGREVMSCLKPLIEDVAGILIYGSWARGEEDQRSDVDICLVAPAGDGVKLTRKALSLTRDDRFDIRVFEMLPLYLKMAVI